MQKTLFSILFLGLALGVFAQDTVHFQKVIPESKKSIRSTEQNIIKISPLAFISGLVPVYYERELTPFLSIQAGAGITTHNYLKALYSTVNDDDDTGGDVTWNQDFSGSASNYLGKYDYKNRKSGIGYYFSFQPRIYFQSEGLDGSFLGLSYDYTHYVTNQKKIIPGQSGDPQFTGGNFSEFEKLSDISAWFGTQTLYDRISVEYSLGVGLRKIRSSHYAYSYAGNELIDGVLELNKTKVAFNLSLKVGYHF